jgi:hypothetical protein
MSCRGGNVNLQQSTFPRDMNVKKGTASDQEVEEAIGSVGYGGDTIPRAGLSRVQTPGLSESAGDVTPTASR